MGKKTEIIRKHMKEKLEITGEWFLLTNKENRVHGTLTFDPQDGTDLELYGGLEGDNFFPEFRACLNFI